MGASRKKPLAKRLRRARAGRHRPSWKLLGLAGVAGVAATGVVVARHRRAQVELPPDELRRRLHERLGDAAKAPEPDPSAPPG
jgi:hypothetical protein